MRTETVTTDEGFRLHCTLSGAGGRILLALHGGPGGAGGGYLEPLHRLSGPDRTVATFDQLGTGSSELPPYGYGWSLARAVAEGERLWFADGALRDWDVEPRLPEITAPTLVVHGGDDMSSADANRVLAERIPDSEWLTMNHNGHTIFHAPNAPAYLAIVRAFLDGWDEQS
ncbi:alpha/beta fold hydrolase [Streptomyces sp. MBT62]|uniref:alpha/beta fold hydrolase n=1 Tax=Streptomyces sp. MBT62 TaxID=2800410 RepID=UPI00190DABE2|nr:hypothetical protein [Streptomyces sp. MBT62]MBK3565922.1 hypothetical protein [Streptomyces sp. MBT62]